MGNKYELGYTPNNLKQVIVESGLSQPAFAKEYDMPWASLSKWLLPVTSGNHRDMPLKRWLELLRKINANN